MSDQQYHAIILYQKFSTLFILKTISMKQSSTIKKVMTKNPLSVKTDSRLTEVIRKIEDNHFDHLPVLDHEGKLQGIISKSDLYSKALSLSRTTSGKSYSEKLLFVTKAEDIMTLDPVSVTSNQSIEYAIELLLQDKFHALPVIDDGQLVGIVTSKDILESIVDQKVTP